MNWKKKALLSLVAILAMVLATYVVMACGNGPQAGAGCGMHGKMAAGAPMKGASMKVANTGNGVRITLTSDKPEVVKALQEHATQCATKRAEMGMGFPMTDAAIKATNLDNGVEISLSSDKSEVVTALQAHAAQCAARRENAGVSQCCGKMGHGPMGADCPMKGASMQVATLPNGATITLTSDDPDVAKSIQAHAEQCAARHGKASAAKQ